MCALKGANEGQLAFLEDREQGMYPRRIVIGCHNQTLCPHQATGILPAAGLPEDVKTTNMSPDQTSLGPCCGNLIDCIDTTEWSGNKLPDEIDIVFFLDDMLTDPTGLVVRPEHHG